MLTFRLSLILTAIDQTERDCICIIVSIYQCIILLFQEIIIKHNQPPLEWANALCNFIISHNDNQRRILVDEFQNISHL